MSPRNTRVRITARSGKKSPSTAPAPARKHAGAQISATRRAPVQRRSRDTVEVLLAAAGRLLVQRGYALTSTADVARVAGVSIGSLYQYFADKDALFQELLRRHRAEVHALVEVHLQDLADVRCDPVDAMDDLLRGLVKLHQRDPDLMRALARELGGSPGKLPGAHVKQHAAVEVIERLITERGDIHTAAPAATAQLLVVIVSRAAEWLAHEVPAGVDPEPILQQMRRVVASLFGRVG